MRTILFLLAALTFGCDDPAVASKALDVLEHGSVAASADCAFTADSGFGSDLPALYRVHLLADGATHATASISAYSATRLCGRSEACSSTGLVSVNESETPYVQFSFFEGDALTTTSGGTESRSIETYCTGFNFEAFGVE